jgi:hypothetical protein
MRKLGYLIAVVGAFVLLDRAAFAQQVTCDPTDCCGKVCAAPAGCHAPDHQTSTRCNNPAVDGSVAQDGAGCVDLSPVACIGGNNPTALTGCICVAGTGIASSSDCKAAAVTGCADGMATHSEANDPDCPLCPA